MATPYLREALRFIGVSDSVADGRPLPLGPAARHEGTHRGWPQAGRAITIHRL
jgi:hypothetical protein